jgi:hypothetical protein
VGAPYRPHPLIGAVDSPEVFTVALNAFDCVTFIETVLALAQSRDAVHFAAALRGIRYADGRVEWSRRNHYITDWIRNNVRAGSVQTIPALQASVEKRRTLNVVPGLSERRARFACIPKKDLPRQAGRLRTGDLIFFASMRRNLDVFHCGIVINNGKGLLLRHASRSRGRVVEQRLAEFLQQNRMPGVIVVRPTEVQ